MGLEKDMTMIFGLEIEAAKADLNKMKKEELIDWALELECMLGALEDKFSKGKVFKTGRKEQVLNILKRGEAVSISDIATEIGIKSRNVSSQLSYLRDDGVEIVKIGRGKGLLKLVV